MEIVIAELMHYILRDQHARHHTYSKATDVNKGERFVPGDIAQYGDKVVSDHVKELLDVLGYSIKFKWLQKVNGFDGINCGLLTMDYGLLVPQ